MADGPAPARIAVVIPSWNGIGMIERCLASVAAQDVASEIEVVVWDNGSADGTPGVVRRELGRHGLRHEVLESGRNVGFAAACNGAIAESEAELVLTLNQDVELAPDYVRLLAAELAAHSEAAAVQGAILREDGQTVDSLGQRPTLGRRCRDEGAGALVSTDGASRACFGVCAAAAMYRREALRRVARPGAGPFAVEFFAYYEDLDLSWRLRAEGYEARVVPQAKARHRRGGSAEADRGGAGGRRMLARLTPELRRRVLANRWLTLLGNDRGLSLVARLPAVIAAEVALCAFVARWDSRSVLTHLRSLPSTIARGLGRRRELRRPGESRRQPTIAIVITKLELGGAQQVALAVAAEMARRDVRVVFACNDEGLLRPACEAIPGLVRYFLPDLVREIRPAADIRAYRQLKAILRREGVDLVHTHSSKAGILGRLAARAAGVRRVVHTVHGFGWNDAQRWPVRAALVAVERIAGRATDRFVLVSRRNLERGRRSRVLDAARAVVIRAGVDLDAFGRPAGDPHRLRRELGVPEGGRVVGTVACLKPQKAPLDFVAVAERVVRSRPDVTFLLAGDGEMRDEVESAITRRGLSDRVRLLGWRHDVPELMRTFDLFLLTSHWEGLPMVLPQARASGLPIVATDVDGNREAVEDGVQGMLRPAGDIDGLASACLELLGDEEGRRAMGRAAAEGLAEFDLRAMLDAHVALYEELLERDLPERA